MACRGSQLLNHTIAGQVSGRQLTSVWCPSFWPVTDNLLFKREKSTKDGREVLYLDCLHTKRTCYQPSYRAWSLDSKNVWMGGGDRRYPCKFRYRVEE